MIQRLINSKNFVAFVLTAITGMALYFYIPFPDQNIFLQLMALRAPLVFEGVKWSYTLFLFTTPYIVFSILLSGLYIFALKAHRKITAGRLPHYPDPRERQDVFVVVGEVHNPRKPVPSETPRWLTIPQRGLFTGIAIVGAVGTGKTSCCMYPFVEQLAAYRAADAEKKIGGLVLEVKGDFCHQVKEILTRHGRAEDYIEISLDSQYRYNPLHNDLDAYALAYSIASLLNNLFGKGKEPFWQQAYTNLVKFIILLHKITYDYVTLFDVYQCAISPDKLEKTIHEAEQKIGGRRYVLVSAEAYFTHVSELAPFQFTLGVADSGMYRADDSEQLRVFLHNKGIEFEALTESSPDDPDSFKREQLEAVKRWFYDDWRRIEPKLRTSIVEGISVFLSLFDDNPRVKRTFCPPAKCYDSVANADGKFGKPLPSFRWLIENGKVCALNFPIGLNPGLARALAGCCKTDDFRDEDGVQGKVAGEQGAV